MSSTSTRRQVAAFRKQELQECLERLGLKKLGVKAELQQRLLAIFDEANNDGSSSQLQRDQWRVTAAQRIIDDVYQKMMTAPHTGLRAAVLPHEQYQPGSDTYAASTAAAGGGLPVAPGAAGGAAAADLKVLQHRISGARPGPGPTRLLPDPDAFMASAIDAMLRQVAPSSHAAARANRTVRCICSSQAERGTMLQCRAAGCGVWQHAQCVGVGQGMEPAGGIFHCEVCRAQRADPFWEVVASDIMQPARLQSTGRQGQVNSGMQQIRITDRTFALAPQHYERLKRRPQAGGAEYQLQLACLQLNDPVPFRFHWPLAVNLSVNGVPYRVYSRAPGQKLGTNARDEPASIGMLVRPAPEKSVVHMDCSDSTPYVLVVLLVRRRSLEEVKQLMAPPLSMRDAVDRVRHQVRGDADEDLQTERTVLSLRCPLLGSRVRVPGRFAEVRGLACFDLAALLDSCQRTRKWQCPLTMANSSVHTLQVDTYVKRILERLEGRPGVTEVEVSPDGRWRPAGSRDPFMSIEEDSGPQGAAGRREGGDGAGREAGAGSDEDEETDEEEELRQAAAAMRRKRVPSPEVIVINSDSDDDEQPGGPAGRPPLKRRAVAPQTPPPPPPHNQQQSIQRQGSLSMLQPRPADNGGAAAGPGPSSVAAAAANGGPMRVKLTLGQHAQQQQQQQQLLPQVPSAGGGLVAAQRQHYEALAGSGGSGSGGGGGARPQTVALAGGAGPVHTAMQHPLNAMQPTQPLQQQHSSLRPGPPAPAAAAGTGMAPSSSLAVPPAGAGSSLRLGSLAQPVASGIRIAVPSGVSLQPQQQQAAAQLGTLAPGHQAAINGSYSVAGGAMSGSLAPAPAAAAAGYAPAGSSAASTSTTVLQLGSYVPAIAGGAVGMRPTPGELAAGGGLPTAGSGKWPSSSAVPLRQAPSMQPHPPPQPPPAAGAVVAPPMQLGRLPQAASVPSMQPRPAAPAPPVQQFAQAAVAAGAAVAPLSMQPRPAVALPSTSMQPRPPPPVPASAQPELDVIELLDDD